MKDLLEYTQFVERLEKDMDSYIQNGVIHHFSVDDLIDEIVGHKLYRSIAVNYTNTPVPGEDFFMGFEIRHESGCVYLDADLTKDHHPAYRESIYFGDFYVGPVVTVNFHYTLADPNRQVSPHDTVALHDGWFEFVIH